MSLFVRVEHTLYYRSRTGHVFSEITSQKFSGNIAIQKNFNGIENMKNPNHI